MRERPHDRDALLLAAREPIGILVALVAEAEAVEKLDVRAALPRPASGRARERWRERDVAENRHVREEVVGLEDDPDLPPHPVLVHARRRDLVAVDHDPPGVDRLDQVDAAKERRLPRARCADQADTSCSGDRRASIPRSTSVLSERLARPDRARSASVTGSPALRGPARSRAASQSVNRASGIVIATKSAAAARYGVKLKVASTSMFAWLNASTAPIVRDERRVLLQPDEVVQQGRDHPPHGLGQDHEAERLQPASGRATGRPPPARDAPTRFPTGRPRRRRPCRSRSARRSPRTSPTSGGASARAPARRSRGSRSRESSARRGRSRRRRSRARASGKKTGPGRLRITASTRAKTRISTSEMQKIFTFSLNAWAIPPKESRNWSQSEERALHLRPAGRLRDHDGERPRRRRPCSRARSATPRRPSPARQPPRTFELRAFYFRTGAPVAFASHCCWIFWSCAAALHRCERPVDARRRAGCPSRRPCRSARRRPTGRELPEDLRVRHLDRRDVERGRQVDDEPVDLPVLQRLDRRGVLREDRRLLRRLDRARDEASSSSSRAARRA